MKDTAFSMNTLAISIAEVIAKDANSEEIARAVHFLNLLQQALKTYL